MLIQQLASRQINIPLPSRVVLCLPINACVANYNTTVVMYKSYEYRIFIGHSIGSFLALLSVYIYTKMQGNRERQELSATLREQSQQCFAKAQEEKLQLYGTVTIALNYIANCLCYVGALYSVDHGLRIPIVVGGELCGEALAKFNDRWVRLSNYLNIFR